MPPNVGLRQCPTTHCPSGTEQGALLPGALTSALLSNVLLNHAQLYF